APEQRVDAKEVDWRADQYALGVVMYELFTGTLPAGTVRPVDHVRPDVPKRYAAAVMRAMSSRPEDRFESLDALLAEMEAPQPRRFGVGLLLAGAGLAAAAAAAFVFFGPQFTSSPSTPVAQLEGSSRGGDPSASDAQVLGNGQQQANAGGAGVAAGPVDAAAGSGSASELGSGSGSGLGAGFGGSSGDGSGSIDGRG